MAFLALISIPAIGQASPFLVSDPWDAGSPQPTSCLYQEVGTTTVVEAAVAFTGANLPFCKFDLQNVERRVYQLEVWARNMWGDSNKVPFVLDAAKPESPTGLHLTQ